MKMASARRWAKAEAQRARELQKDKRMKCRLATGFDTPEEAEEDYQRMLWIESLWENADRRSDWEQYYDHSWEDELID